jgi:hypothetical protein
MNISLRPPIDVYFASEDAHDPSVIDQCFAAGAFVRDEGKTITGVAAIKAWRIETGEKYHHVVEPLSVSTRDGKVVVTAKVSGNFPGSPIKLEHLFEIEGGRIVSLEIRP